MVGILKSKSIWIIGAILLGALYCLYDTQAIVDGHRISRTQVSLKNSINLIYSYEEKRKLGLDQLIRAWKRFGVLKRQGFQLNENDLKSDLQRIKNESRNPEKLNEILNVFKNNEADLLWVFVFPSLVEQKIYSLGSYANREFHKESFEKASEFIKSYSQLDSSNLKTKAEELNLHFRKIKYSESKGVLWQNPYEVNKSYMPKPSFSKIPKFDEIWKSHLKDLNLNEFISEPVDYEDAWLIIVKRSKDSYDTVVFMKRDISAWVEEESQKISVWINPFL